MLPRGKSYLPSRRRGGYDVRGVTFGHITLWVGHYFLYRSHPQPRSSMDFQDSLGNKEILFLNNNFEVWQFNLFHLNSLYSYDLHLFLK